MKVFAIYDRKAAVYLNLVTYPNEEVFLRDLSGAVNEPSKSNLLSMYPSDFEACFIAEFSPENGIFSDNKPRVICNLQSLVRKEFSND